jgi:hypothetical protein
VTIRRRVGVALLALGTVLIALAFSVSPVQAEAPSQTGWWFELQTKTLPAPLPSPPVVPDGGLYVQQGPQGPTAYGAVHYDAASASSATLTLTTAPGSTASLGAPVQACATKSQWKAPDPPPGAWEDAPKYGDPCTPGRIAADGSAVAFAFDTSFFAKTGLDVAIVPIEGATPYSLMFNKPSADSLQVTTKSPTLSSTPPVTSVTTPTAGAVSSPSKGAAVPTAKVAAPSAPAAAPPAPAAAETRPSVTTNVLKLAGLGDPDRGARMAALSGASAIVVGWWMLSTRAVRTPRLLGALAGAGAGADAAVPSEPAVRVAGVGRFARARTTSPRRLR